LSLKRSTPNLFDLMKEGGDIQLLWVKIHSLLLELWSKRDLTLIRNRVARMLDRDEKSCSLHKTSMGNICVEMDMRTWFA
jgi:hypothetical protein